MIPLNPDIEIRALGSSFKSDKRIKETELLLFKMLEQIRDLQIECNNLGIQADALQLKLKFVR